MAKCSIYEVNLSGSGSLCRHYEQQTGTFQPIKIGEDF